MSEEPKTVTPHDVAAKMTAYPNPKGFAVKSSDLGDNWSPQYHLARLRAEAEAKAQTAMDHLMEQVDWQPIGRPAEETLNEQADLPYATHSGILILPGFGECRVYQLNTGMRLIDADDFQRMFGVEEEPEA